MADNVQRRMALGAVWMMLFKLTERSLGLISTLILVRVLSPGDFGVVAMALSFIAMAELVTSLGFDVALIQNQQATEAHYNTAWTGNLFIGVLITVLMLALAAPIAGFYGRPEVFWVVCALAFGPLLGGCENIGVVAFRKELDFRKEFAFQITRSAIRFLVVVPLALWLRSYWALVAGMLASRLAGSVVSYLVHPFRPRLSVALFGQLFHFSRWLLLINLTAYFKERSADFFIGRLYGAAPLGLYTVSYELSNLPLTELGAPINRALLPGFAMMGSPEEVRSAYGHTIGLLAFLALPAAAGMYAIAPHLVPVMLGANWLESVALMEVLAFNGALLLLHSSICAVLIGRGHPESVLMTNGFYVVVLLALLGLLSIPLGVIGAAYAALSASLLSTPLYLYQMRKRLAIEPTVFVRGIIRPAIAASVMIAIVRWSLPEYQPAMPVFHAAALMVGGVLLGTVTYAAGAVALWLLAGRPAGPEIVVFDFLRTQAVRRLGARFKRTGT